MAFTLSDAKQLSQDKLTHFVIDEFRRSPLIDAMIFDDTVKPQGGETLTYVYNRITTQPTASGRAINTEYTAQETKTTQIATNLKIFGGSFNLDRVIINNEKQVVNHVEFQMAQKIKATRALFCDMFVNGDSATDSTIFDGLDKALTGSSTERDSGGIDLSTAAAVEANWKQLLYEFRQGIKLLDGEPTLVLMNSDMHAVMQSVADFSTQFTQIRSEMGAPLLKYGNSILMDVGDKPGTATPIISNDVTTARTDIYFVRIGLDGVHGVTPDGSNGPTYYLPDMTAPGAVKAGEVEMVAAMALKATRAAGVLRGLQAVPV